MKAKLVSLLAVLPMVVQASDFHLLQRTQHASIFRYKNIMIELRNGQDIVDYAFRVDAIVNAANEGCLGGGGIDGAISEAGGQPLFKARLALPQKNGVRLLTGQAVLTISGDIFNAPYVIHALGPQCASRAVLTAQQQRDLCDAYVNPLKLIADWNVQDSTQYPEFKNISSTRKIQSVAFPAIGLGNYNCNVELAAPCVAQALLDYLDVYSNRFLKHIYFVFYNPVDPAEATRNYKAYEHAFISLVK